MAKSDLGFARNYANALEINITPGNDSPTWAIFSRGITSITPSGNESTEDKDYYDGFGVPTTDVTSTQIQYAVEGDRCYGDPAQDFVASIALETGEGRKTQFRHTAPNGDVIEGACTLLGLTPNSGQGEASALGAFSCTVATDGRPSYKPGNKLKLPEQVTAEAVSVTVGGTAKIEPSVTPTEANPKCFYASGNTDVATVDSDGNVKGVAEGKATITVRAASKPSVMKSVEVTVSPATDGGMES